jgi:hypothetical protein
MHCTWAPDERRVPAARSRGARRPGLTPACSQFSSRSLTPEAGGLRPEARGPRGRRTWTAGETLATPRPMSLGMSREPYRLRGFVLADAIRSAEPNPPWGCVRSGEPRGGLRSALGTRLPAFRRHRDRLGFRGALRDRRCGAPRIRHRNRWAGDCKPATAV